MSEPGSAAERSSTPTLRSLALDDRYRAQRGAIMLGGIHALVRLMLDVRRLDQRRGFDTGVYVSGYEGSPLGGLDKELARTRGLLDEAGIVFAPGLNEELAATAVGGTQLLGQLAGARKQGVTGFWYGKSPGLDRAADAIRHANLSGTAPLGGAVALIGDDPTSKSSTVPSSSEAMCRSLLVPVLVPGTVQEILTLGMHAVAISRHAGTWAALRIVADLADSAGEAQAQEALEAVPELPVRESGGPVVLLPPSNLEAEHDLFTQRLARVREYARAAKLNRIAFDPHRPRVGVIASGVCYQALERALDQLGLDALELEAIGLRLISLAMPWPLARPDLRELCAGLERVLVIEDKLPFVEAQLKEAFYRVASAPLVLGKRDQNDRPLLPVGGAVNADDVRVALARILPDEWLTPGVRECLRRAAPARPGAALAGAGTGAGRQAGAQGAVKRTPYFCSGCPHNTSTRADSDQLVGVGIGCHTMVALDQGDRRGQLLGMTQMGGEGAQWFGLSAFTSEPHFSQNMGDGTFHHSGSLAIRAAVAAGVNITYRLLYNDAVAMTGGQHPEGQLPIPALVSELALERVARVVITTPEPERYRHVKLDPIASVRHRDDYEQVSRELAAVPGVTVLIHDDRCATEKRRLRKRGLLETPRQRVWINERVCEGCGDCGEKSSCLSVLPVRTEYGRKTQIHQGSCNFDMLCVKGDCPAFVLVTPRTRKGSSPSRRRPAVPAPPEGLPDPALKVATDVLIRMPGIGGTGVVTAAALLRTAAFLEGQHAAGLDQTGLSQKGGPVISDLRIAASPVRGQLRATRGEVDVLLGFDLLGCADPLTLATLDRERTIAVVNSDVMPTAASITNAAVGLPLSAQLMGQLRRATRAAELLALSAQTLSERLFDDHMQANVLLIGAAFQHGCLPLSAAAIERAIKLNGAAVERNIAAFRWGRASVADPAGARHALGLDIGSRRSAPKTLEQLIERRAGELRVYQDASYAHRYISDVRSLQRTVTARLGGGDDRGIVRAYAAGLFKLMAYKDEYEVARLHLDTLEQARLHAQFGEDLDVKVLLHPPFMRALGLEHKLAFGRSATPLFKLLRAGRFLRGTQFDPFAHTEVRRVERALIDEYRELLTRALGRLDEGNAALVRELAELPEIVRGYERIKLGNVKRMRARAAELEAQLDAPGAAAVEQPGLQVIAAGA